MDNQSCHKCGKENITNSAWCEYCLNPFKIYGEDKVHICPECFHSNSYVDDYCERCNEPLKPGQVE